MQHAVHNTPLWLGGTPCIDATLTKEGRYDVSSPLNLEHNDLVATLCT